MRTSTSTSFTDIDPTAWDALDQAGSPFLRHAFLAGLEETGCVGEQTGWLPSPITLHDGHGLAGAVPAYIKTHSFGEFVFDQGWAQAYAQHGLAYYPKLLLGVPFTPATGARLLVRPDLDAREVRRRLITAIREFAAARGLSSIHALFVDDPGREAFTAEGWLARRDVQFHWHNQGYRDFENYLSQFTAEKRKKARRERRRVFEEGITFETLSGASLDRRIVDETYSMMRDTFLRHGNEPYLTRAFFRALPEISGDSLVIKRARRDGECIASSVFFRGRNVLYGRYWGSHQHHHSLHFEACYHQGVDYCIENGIGLFDPGVQGVHKISRGFVPANSWSLHWIVDTRFRAAIADYLQREGLHVDAWSREIEAHVPFRDARRQARSS
jgi:predicted N-acyltransferase